VRAVAVLLLALALGFVAEGQEKESTTSLKDTLTWMSAFMKGHGLNFAGGAFVQSTTIPSFEGCLVTTKHTFFKAKTANDVKPRTESVDFAELNPDSVKVSGDGSDVEMTFLVQIERSDSEPKIQSTYIMGDRSKHSYFVTIEYWTIDSQETGDRFANALRHAVKLCGGKPAPF
jgi:hypothetical protein